MSEDDKPLVTSSETQWLVLSAYAFGSLWVALATLVLPPPGWGLAAVCAIGLAFCLSQVRRASKKARR